MYGCESWTIKKAECRRIDTFEVWCWRRLLRVPWTARRSNQFVLKEISPECYWKDWYWSWSSNTLATWCKELTHLKRPWRWERLKAEGEGDNRGWDGWMVSLTQWTWVWVNSGSWWQTGRPGVLQSMGLQRVGHDWVTQLNWTDSLIQSLWQPPKISLWQIMRINYIYSINSSLNFIVPFSDNFKDHLMLIPSIRKPYQEKQRIFKMNKRGLY